VRIDRAAAPFILIAAIPALVAALFGWMIAAGILLFVPIAIALFFRDPERHPPPDSDAVLAPADGKVMFAGPARANEAPPGEWLQVTIFLSLLDVHINRTPVAGRVTRVDFVPGSFLPAYKTEAARNEHSEIWLDRRGRTIICRQVVGLLARRVVTRIQSGDTLEPGARIGLMKFGSRMDVFVPVSATVQVKTGAHVRGGETVIARLAPE
jgi:phosphatidylserine decarboxylase